MRGISQCGRSRVSGGMVGESQEEWGWTDTPGPGGHDKNFAYLLERFFGHSLQNQCHFQSFWGILG